jgi:hypothetical protein
VKKQNTCIVKHQFVEKFHCKDSNGYPNYYRPSKIKCKIVEGSSRQAMEDTALATLLAQALPSPKDLNTKDGADALFLSLHCKNTPDIFHISPLHTTFTLPHVQLTPHKTLASLFVLSNPLSRSQLST